MSELGVPKFLDTLQRHGDAPALLSGPTTVSFTELARSASAMADSWGPGRHLVLIRCANTVDTIVAYVAALGHGHVAILAPAGADALIESLVTTYRPDVVVTDGVVWRAADSAPPMHADLALILTTSGSTGSSKVVRLSYRNLQANADSIIDYLGIAASDRAITSLPMHYCYGLSVVSTHLEAGASLVLTENSVADPCFWELAADQQVTSFAGVPHTFDVIDRAGFDLPESLSRVTQAGGRMPESSVRAWAARDFDFFVMYGQTEATARMSYVPPSAIESAADAIGQPIPGGLFRLDPVPELDDPGVGELVYLGDNVMMGYAECLPDLAAGHTLTELRTGDLARLGDDGFYRWVGRRNRIAKVFGLRIDLDHLELALTEIGLEAACVEVGDGIGVATTSAGGALDAVARVTGLPRHAVFARTMDELPTTASGKVDYPVLRGIFEASDRLGTSGAPRTVLATYALVLHRPDATASDSFTSLSGDSLSYVELSVRLADLGIETSPGWQHRTIAELASTASAGRTWSRMDSTIVLRAVAIVLIVVSHSGVYRLAGGAHVLLAVAGYNFARFQLGPAPQSELWRARWRSLAQVMAPCMAWVVAVAVVFGAYDLQTVLMLNQGDGDLSARRLWFIEAYFWAAVIMILMLAVPYVDRLQRRSPFGLAVAAVVAALVARFAYTGVQAEYVLNHEYDLAAVGWCFAAGWAAAVAPGRASRAILTVLCGVGSFGLFIEQSRVLVLFIGLMVLTWLPFVPMARRLARPLGLLAGASLFIFISHFQFLPALRDINQWLAVVAALAFGIAFERLWSIGVGRFRSWTTSPTRVPPTANAGTSTPR